jgi:rubredoxin
MKIIQLKSTITCPECGFSREEIMPVDSCQFFDFGKKN